MATFKPGQHVKLAWTPLPEFQHDIGCQGIIISGPEEYQEDTSYIVNWLNGSLQGHSRERARCLVPAIDPRADQFIASLERLGREPLVPVVDPLRQVKAYIDIARGGR